MRHRLRQITVATTACVGALVLVGCVTNTEDPATFAATVTVTGEADQASSDSGVCIIGTTRLAPGDEVSIYGESAAAIDRSRLEVKSIDENANGTGVCTYQANFEAVPANQRSYQLFLINDFVDQSFTFNELSNGATYVVPSSAP